MTSRIKYLIGAAGLTVALLGATPALAAGTASGSTITNTATVNYQVGGVAQTAVNAVNTFTVDRKITLTVTQLGSTTTSVTPGQAQAATTFQVTNTANAVIDIGLTAANIAGGAAPNGGGNDVFDTGTFAYYLDDGDNLFDGGDTLITYLDESAIDTIRVVHVVTSIPLGATNGQKAAISLTGQGREGGTAGTQGAVITATAGANTTGIDTVLADVAGTDDAAADGRHSARDDYTVAAPTLTVAKQSRVLEDPINTIASGNSANAKLIPGATVQYCVVVTNAAGGAGADSVAISDPIPTNTTFVAGTIRISGTYTGTPPTGTCNADGVVGGSFASNTVSGNLGTIAAGTTRTLYFNVTIN